jgi:hypothetical protein
MLPHNSSYGDVAAGSSSIDSSGSISIKIKTMKLAHQQTVSNSHMVRLA